MNYMALFEEQVALTSKDLCQEIESIDALLAEKLQRKLEGKCSRHGYVVAGSLKVLSRSMGAMERGRFTGSILYYIQAEANVLNPPEGSHLEGVVIRKNKMGIYVSYSVNDGENEAIRVIVPRDLHIGDDAFEAVEIGETVKVEIKKSRFQINDPYILSVGMFLSSSGKGVKAPVEAVEADEVLEEGEEGAEDAEGEEGAEEVEDEDVEVVEGEEGAEVVEGEEGAEEVEGEEGAEEAEVAEGEAKEEEA
jgi:DNA-directed RNA polymerase subunit E'/Rpb7